MLVNGPLYSLFPTGACGKTAFGMGCFSQPRPCFLLVAELWFGYSCLKKCRAGAKCCSFLPSAALLSALPISWR